MIQEIIINGLINGSIYALLAIGFSLIFGVARIVNIAHTALYMTAAYLIYMGLVRFGLPPLLVIPASILLTTILGLISYQLFIKPIREHEAAVLIATIALAMAIQEVFLLAFKGHYLGVPPLATGYVTIAGVKVAMQHVLALGVAVLALVGTWFLLLRTRVGLGIRCTAQDREVANLMGISVNREILVAIGISVGMAAIAGAIVAPLRVIDPHMWTHPLIMMLAIVVLGGLGSIKGSFIASYILGFTEALVVFAVPMGAFLQGPVALSIMILALLIRPEGLFGVAFEEER
jgi:branched-chain amino acid transport system permease protein